MKNEEIVGTQRQLKLKDPVAFNYPDGTVAVSGHIVDDATEKLKLNIKLKKSIRLSKVKLSPSNRQLLGFGEVAAGQLLNKLDGIKLVKQVITESKNLASLSELRIRSNRVLEKRRQGGTDYLYTPGRVGQGRGFGRFPPPNCILGPRTHDHHENILHV